MKYRLLLLMSIVGCFLFWSEAASAQILGYLDSENATSFSSWTTTNITVGGWAVAEEDNKPATSVQILIDNKLVGTVAPSIARTDVVAYLGNNAAFLNSGWSFSYNAGANLAPGSHTLSALALDAEGISAPLTLAVSQSFTILAPQPPMGFLDNMSATSVTQSQSIVISGWAGDPQDGAPVKQVQILMDGKAIGNATLGGARPDVLAVYPTYLKAGWSFTYSAANLAGSHTFTAVASDKESLSTTLQVIAQNTITVLAPDLVENTVAVVGGSQTAGGTVQISDTVLNQGNGSAGGSTTGFYLSSNGTTKGTYLGYRYVGTLAAGITSVSSSTTLTLPTNLTGTNYVIVCANYNNGIVESSTANNCTATGGFTVAGATLDESAVTLLTTPTSGGSVQIQDTVTNGGGGTAASSTTGFFLSTNSTAKEQGTYFGYRYVGALSANATSTATTTLTLPGNLSGTYYVIVCANYNNGITETSTANNCAVSAQFNIAGADLTETAVSTNPAAVLPGGTLAITDTTADAFANANGSTTRYYLSTTMSLVKSAAVLLGQRSVPALTPTTASSGSVSVTIAASTVAGNYYIFACANDTGSVAESNTANNCTPTPVVVYTSPKTVFVDQNNLNASDTSCGTSAVPCRTITEGLAAANTGQTVLVNSGSYTEQVSITQNITLASTLKNTAIVQAPAALTADSNGLFTLVNVGGGATATIVNMGVSGPGSSGCDSINYGVFVTNANATIVGNKVMSIRDTPYSGCQNGIAIRFGSKALGFVGHTGTIAYNTISDYQKGGIVVDGIGTNVNVVSNVVTGQNIPAVNGQNGIQISRGAFSLVNGNTVNGSVYGTSLASVSADGILLYDVVGGVTVTNNTVSGNDEGIGIYTDTTNYTTETATNVTIQNNQAINNVYLGIHIDPFSTGNTIWNNTATSNGTWDELDEHPDFTYNNWGTIPSQYNTLGTAGAHVGLVFTY